MESRTAGVAGNRLPWLTLDALIPPGGPPPNRRITLATHTCARCPAQEMPCVQGADLEFVDVGVH